MDSLDLSSFFSPQLEGQPRFWSTSHMGIQLLEALEQFNSIPELGPTVGEGLPSQFERLNISLKVCPASEEDIALADSTVCPYCGLRLSEVIPYTETEALLMDMEQCVREQNSHLSLHGIQQILEQGDEQMVDKLIKIVRMADLSPLANAISPQVLTFLRDFLANR